MENTENYEELKGTAKGFFQLVTSDDLYYGLFLLIVMVIAVNVIDLIFLPFRKTGKENITLNFIKLCLKVFVVVVFGMKIFTLIPGMDEFAEQILMSSSLIVVVLGFVFQEGLSNIVHGVILSLFQPFNLGDRVHVIIDGENITGYIRKIDLRHTVIENVMNASRVIVPNSKMDLCVIDNFYYDKDRFSTNFLDISITYESNLEKALQVMEEIILAHPMVQQTRKEKKITGPLNPLVRELGDSAIYLRASVTTLTVEDNFAACSDIRRALWARFNEDPELNFAYPHIHIVSDGDEGKLAEKYRGGWMTEQVKIEGTPRERR